MSGGRTKKPRPLPPLPLRLAWRSLVAGERDRRSDDAASSIGVRGAEAAAAEAAEAKPVPAPP
eukprot:2094153-Lingulodinium_polyedra.AAC.1